MFSIEKTENIFEQTDLNLTDFSSPRHRIRKEGGLHLVVVVFEPAGVRHHIGGQQVGGGVIVRPTPLHTEAGCVLLGV